MMMMMMMMCKRLVQVPMPCVPIYNMKLAMMQKNFHFYYVFSTYEDGRRQTRAKPCVRPKYYNIIMYVCIYIHIDDSIIEIFQNVSLITNQNNTLFRTPRSCIKAAKRFSKHQKRHRQTNKYGHTNDIPPMISHYIPL